MELKRFGTEYGGFYYPKNLDGLNEDSIIYCVGVGEDISHDIEIANKLNSDVYLFDPTPRAIEHVKYIKNLFDGKEPKIDDKRYGGGDLTYLDFLLKNKINTDKIHIFDYGLFVEDTTIKFYKPSNENYVSHSVVYGMKGTNYINVDVKKLRTIMNENGHKNIDLLKIDIEGCECDVLEQMIEEQIFPKYLSVDFDLGWHGEKIKDRNKCMKTIDLLKTHGYKKLHDEGSNFSFVRN